MLSATLYGDVIEAIKAMFATAGLLSAWVTVQPSDSKERAAWHCADLGPWRRRKVFSLGQIITARDGMLRRK